MALFSGNQDSNFSFGEGIVAQGLEKVYGKRMVVKGISLHVHKAEIVGLLGPNGAGKTTTFSMLVGLIRPYRGEVFLHGQRITRLNMYKRARLGIGYLPQEMSVFRRLSVEDNIRSVLDIQGYSKDEIERKTNRLIEELSLERVRTQMAYTLSGGEKRRTEVARILAIDPDFLLLDEPFTGIDPIAISDIQQLVVDLRQSRGLGVLITDHNVRETLKIVDRAYITYDGQILISGDTQTLVNDPEAKKVYLGKDFSI